MPPSFRSKLDALKRAAPRRMQTSRLAAWYVKFRGSTWFLNGLLSIIGGWLTTHWIWHLDPDLGGINLFLSAEASISLAFFTILSEVQSIWFERMLEHQQKQTELLIEISTAIYDIASEIKRALGGNHGRTSEKAPTE